MTDEGSESSCEEICSIDAPGSSASSSKTNSDSGIATDPCGVSGGQGSLSSLSNDEAEKDNKSIPSEGDTSVADKNGEVIEGQHSSTSAYTIENGTSNQNDRDGLGSDENPNSTNVHAEIEISTRNTSDDIRSEEISTTANANGIESDEIVIRTDTQRLDETSINTSSVDFRSGDNSSTSNSDTLRSDESSSQNYTDETGSNEISSTSNCDVTSAEIECQKKVCTAELQKIDPVLSNKDFSGEMEIDVSKCSNNLSQSVYENQEVQQTSKEIEEDNEEVVIETTEAFSDNELEEENIFERENICSSDESTLPYTAEDNSIEEEEGESINRLPDNLSELKLQEEAIYEEDQEITGFNDVSMYDLDHLELEPDPPPVAPPRRKKCAKMAEKLATKLSDEIVVDAVSCAAEQKWPITSAVTKWLEDSEDEIEEAEEAITGQKNGEGNPFPAPFHSVAGTRVASSDWYASERSRVRQMCDPISSVNKYYRLALPMKTGPGPFPCGVCCIIQ